MQSDGRGGGHHDDEWHDHPTEADLAAWLDRVSSGRPVCAGRASPVLWDLRRRVGGAAEATLAVPSVRCVRRMVFAGEAVFWGATASRLGWWSGMHLVTAAMPAEFGDDNEKLAAEAEEWAMRAASGCRHA